MNKNVRFIIAINRELGSGGRTIGEKLAARLGVPFYDKALIKALQQKYNLTIEEIENLKGRTHSWWADFKRVMGIGYSNNISQYYNVSYTNEPDLLTSDDIYKAEQEILKGMAESESCVIAGRTAFHMFRKHPNILIQAPMEYRIKRIMNKRGITAQEAEKIIDKVDKMRENYVNRYTGTNRYDTRNYDLVFSSAGKTEDQIVDLIMEYIG